MDEFALIERFRAPFTVVRPEVLLGAGDDAALLRTLPGAHDQAWAISTDTALADRHFPAGAPPALVGYRALATNLSDLAAMGARPVALFVAAVLPDADPVRVDALALGMARLANAAGLALAGGNLARGEFALTIAVHGLVHPDRALRRSGARVGDDVWVSGVIGGAGVGLQAAVAGQVRILPVLLHDWRAPLARYYAPQARLTLGQSLTGLATAAIDVSDGLLADVGHLARASGVAVRLHAQQLPLAPGVTDFVDALSAGDDYELCFTAPPAARHRLHRLRALLDVPLTRIGEIVPLDPASAQDRPPVAVAGARLSAERAGFLHFD